jgi:hypothetical protein
VYQTVYLSNSEGVAVRPRASARKITSSSVGGYVYRPFSTKAGAA